MRRAILQLLADLKADDIDVANLASMRAANLLDVNSGYSRYRHLDNTSREQYPTEASWKDACRSVATLAMPGDANMHELLKLDLTQDEISQIEKSLIDLARSQGAVAAISALGFVNEREVLAPLGDLLDRAIANHRDEEADAALYAIERVLQAEVQREGVLRSEDPLVWRTLSSLEYLANADGVSPRLQRKARRYWEDLVRHI
jgi:hypothetical protein